MITRLAPSPTGALHLGNARTFLANWLLARQRGWKIVLRIEDLDGPRIKRGADQQAIEDLKWLGIDWDEGPIYQSARRESYARAVQQLIAQGNAYPCICTRKEVDLAASAPHAEDGAAVYPGTCRGRFKTVEEARVASGRAPAIRFNVDNAVIDFVDQVRGPRRFEMATLGDFVIEKADGTPAYQLAVVVDDAAMGVTDIVRGNDLIDSTPRQIMLYRALGLADRIPHYCHLPLVTGTDGRRLAKRHGDTRLSYYREKGVPASRVLELLARWMNIATTGVKSASDLIQAYRIDSAERESIVFTAEDDVFLRG
ncbi:MAG TPA: tRNA glutamyl-Q(34) synthetase GluQRS [Tepidisphaeraceae bacterium]|jgi:glutamyl-tRNA synthetase|nr:tRNA glutamyl-Q(34) synthetase GluQRS [Tepidisphaeraceae bacterium]